MLERIVTILNKLNVNLSQKEQTYIRSENLLKINGVQTLKFEVNTYISILKYIYILQH